MSAIQVNDIVRAIQDGTLSNEDTLHIWNEANKRLNLLSSSRNNNNSVANFKVGDKVEFNNTTSTRYLVGVPGTISVVKRSRVGVVLNQDVGRFRAGATIMCPPDILSAR